MLSNLSMTNQRALRNKMSKLCIFISAPAFVQIWGEPAQCWKERLGGGTLVVMETGRRSMGACSGTSLFVIEGHVAGDWTEVLPLTAERSVASRAHQFQQNGCKGTIAFENPLTVQQFMVGLLFLIFSSYLIHWICNIFSCVGRCTN